MLWGRRVPASVAILAFVATAGVVRSPARAGVDDVRVVATMEAVMPFGRVPRMEIDSTLHRGFVLTSDETGFERLFVYDLKALRLIESVALPENFKAQLVNSAAAVDERHHRIFFVQDPRAALGCDSNIWVLRTDSLQWTSHRVPCFDAEGRRGFYIGGISYHEESNKLYVVGHSAEEFYAQNLASVSEARQSVFYRQLDADTMALDWEVDATTHCDWFTIDGHGTGVIRRVGNKVISFCYRGGLRQSAGEVLVMALADDRPVGAPGSEQITTTPMFSAPVKPDIDRSGRVLLTSEVPPFGPAVWVYDALHQRFAGVVPAAIPSGEGSFQRGYDADRGRLYFQSTRGFLTVDVRHRPLPGGVNYPILRENKVDQVNITMAVDPRLRRVFVADRANKRYIVVEDRSPEPADQPPIDYDQGTADIPEEPGKTARAYSAGAGSYGMHLLNTGGIPAALQAATQGNDCNPFATNECATGAVVASGTREYFLAQSALELGSSSGATAFATAGRAAPNDRATDADIRTLGHCAGNRAPDPAMQQGIDEQCRTPALLAEAAKGTPMEGFTFERMRGGTQGGTFPIPGSLCTDFGATPGEQETDKPSPAVGRSEVACDAGGARARAGAESHAANASGAAGVPLLVQHAASGVSTEQTDKGTRSVSWSEATGIRIGEEIRIGRVRSEAIAVAHGRSGTSNTEYSRTISDVRAPGYSCAASCDPKAVAAALNRALPGKMQAFASDPFRVASAKGYTALVHKDPGLRESDRAVNDDETVAVDGLTLVFYNDSYYYQPAMCNGVPCGVPTGNRSRLVIGLAGVQAESHYGVFPLPQTSGGVTPSGGTGNSGGGTEGGGNGNFVDPFDGFASLGPDAGNGPASFPLPGGNGAPNPLIGAVTYPGRAAVDAIRLIVNEPAKAAVLFLFWLLLAAPAYFAIRRMAWRRTLYTS